MNSERLITWFPYLLLLQYSTLLSLSLSFDWHTICSNKYQCGKITRVDFPFWGDGRPENCGYRNLKLGCERNKTTIEIMGVKYQVEKIEQESKTLKIARVDYLNGLCSPQFGNTVLDTELFDYAPASGDITILYGCSLRLNLMISSGGFNCSSSGIGITVPGNSTENISNIDEDLVCRSRVIARVPDPVRSYAGIMNSTMIEEALREVFTVEYKVDFDACDVCNKISNGVCGYDWNSNQTTCHCRNDQSHGLKTCPTTSQSADDKSRAKPERKSAWLKY
ncbi:Wall-associated receptor kinase, C-terminal [Parasponia andersonii]|uniref:non-specific serine/threonine protein kinase n=1 Tax=Parasponia andersonii TaxID=3476 RepID=A0A2P5BWD8_PARAD|nr:Wall-associated receptor kinase, C-terminal [Parasponia andersonii]